MQFVGDHFTGEGFSVKAKLTLEWDAPEGNRPSVFFAVSTLCTFNLRNERAMPDRRVGMRRSI